MEPRLGPHELLHVFSFLEARDLLRAAQVDKLWNEVTSTTELWRQLCLRRWPSCRTSQMSPHSWRQYYLCRSELEFRMESGRPEKDFTCRAITGHKGLICKLAYISTSEYRCDGQEKSVVCTVSSDHTVRAWDLQEAVEIWSSPQQPAALVNLVTFPRLQVVVTVDEQGLIKVWKVEDGWECASFSLPASSSALEACHQPEGPFVLAACADGTLYMLTLPELQLLSRASLFPGNPPSLLCSPDSQWLLTFTQSSDLGAKVIHTRSLLLRQEEEPPVFQLLPVRLTSKACWVPLEAARLIVLHRSDNSEQLVVTTFELGTKKCKDSVGILVQEIASFPLPDTAVAPHLLKAHGSQVVLLVSGLQLMVFTIHGLQLAASQDHQQSITSIWVDESRVVTSSLDLSLRIYMWKKDGKWPVLKSCYHLLGGSHRWSSGFTHVECDSMSIVGVESRKTGTSVLRSYYFRMSRD
ncbi:F-box/WD repeat-containing protein 12-like [Sorex fumeus]|uniref:F-box/WD repeat-containing protein 12-like n=1 Tax=Sorex fumeus TaxID=62283 RepID=UPI0024AD608B|nr:F-box/WD repeat-containing protein 12-like [Sorex fumeus]